MLQMLTKEKIDRFYTDVDSLEIKKKNAVIQRATGFPKSNVSEWLRKIKTPSEKFIDKFYEKFADELAKSSTNVPREKTEGRPNNEGGDITCIELKTASGKVLKVKPEGESEIGLLNAFLEERDRIISEKEQSKRDAELRAEKAEKEKDRLYNLLENKLSDLLINSKTTLEALARIQNITVADDAVNMAYLDKAQGLAPGTSAVTAGNVERELNNLTEETDTKESDSKQSMPRKAK